MNIQHSSRSDRWMTPPYIVERVRRVLGHIDLDPASSTQANVIIEAKSIYDGVTKDGLKEPWFGSVYVNPPGGTLKKKSMTGLFWAKLMEEFEAGRVEQAVFMAFSIEAMQTTQKYHKRSILDFSFCVPKKRIAFVDPVEPTKNAPSHSNVIVYVGPNELEFGRHFEDIGKVVLV